MAFSATAVTKARMKGGFFVWASPSLDCGEKRKRPPVSQHCPQSDKRGTTKHGDAHLDPLDDGGRGGSLGAHQEGELRLDLGQGRGRAAWGPTGSRRGTAAGRGRPRAQGEGHALQGPPATLPPTARFPGSHAAAVERWYAR